MTTLSKAPLVEVATQIRWGAADWSEEGELLGYVFTNGEQTDLPGEFTRVLGAAGYTHVDDFAPELDDVQFAVSRRYRPNPEGWPVLQTGLGVLMVNQANDHYDWPSYRESVVETLRLLREALRRFYEEPPFIGIELMYYDAFPLDEGEDPLGFLRRNFKVKLVPPPAFTSAPFVDPTPASASLSLEMNVTQPVGAVSMNLSFGEALGGRAYMMDTRVRSIRPDAKFGDEDVGAWLDAAHAVQQHTFKTLIKPAYMRSFR